MNPPDLALARSVHPDPEVRLDAIYRPFLRQWRMVAASLLLAWGATLAWILVPAREYQARLVLAAVPNIKMASLAGGLSSLLGSAQMGGVQSTPYFITRLLMLPGVLDSVAHSPVAEGSRLTIIERVLERPAAEIERGEIEPAMRDLIAAEVDKQTGLVTFGVIHEDSALARRVAELVTAVGRQTYGRVLRAQAGDQRAAVEARVDSTRRQLRRAEQALQAFQSSHRVYAGYSQAAVARQGLERDVTSAQAAYAAAVDDRQAAIARELEDTPALVIVDPIPANLAPEPRQGILKLLLGSVLGMVACTMLMALRGDFTTPTSETTFAVGARSAA